MVRSCWVQKMCYNYLCLLASFSIRSLDLHWVSSLRLIVTRRAGWRSCCCFHFPVSPLHSFVYTVPLHHNYDNALLETMSITMFWMSGLTIESTTNMRNEMNRSIDRRGNQPSPPMGLVDTFWRQEGELLFAILWYLHHITWDLCWSCLYYQPWCRYHKEACLVVTQWEMNVTNSSLSILHDKMVLIVCRDITESS